MRRRARPAETIRSSCRASSRTTSSGEFSRSLEQLRPESGPVATGSASLLPVHLGINPVLDLVEQRTAFRLPTQGARFQTAHAAVRSEAEISARAQSLDRFGD